MLDKLAPHSRVWVFQTNRFLTDQEVSAIENTMRNFIPQWASHGNEIYGDFAVAENLFLIVGADEKKSPTSGCSIDSLTRVIKKMGEELKVDFFDRLRVAYVDRENKIQHLPLHEFKNLIKKDEVTIATTVFNNLIENKEELDKKWRSRLDHSWHKNLVAIL